MVAARSTRAGSASEAPAGRRRCPEWRKSGGALRDAAHAHRLHQIAGFPRRHALDPDDGDQRALGRLPRLQKAGEPTAAPQFRNLRLERTEPGLQIPLTVAVAMRGAAVAPLVATGATSPSTSNSISRCSTASASSFRKSPPPRFCSRSSNGIISSVIVFISGRSSSVSNSTLPKRRDDRPLPPRSRRLRLSRSSARRLRSEIPHHPSGRYLDRPSAGEWRLGAAEDGRTAATASQQPRRVGALETGSTGLGGQISWSSNELRRTRRPSRIIRTTKGCGRRLMFACACVQIILEAGSRNGGLA